VSEHTATPWRACIWRHTGSSDTVCIKNADGREIVGWNGFDGVPCTKAEIRANARLIAKAVNSHDRLVKALELAANRLSRCAVEAVGTNLQYEWSEWAKDARAALSERNQEQRS
jgi:hypothetical protein